VVLIATHSGLGLSEDELNTREEELRERAFAVIKDRLVEKSQHIHYQMQKKYGLSLVLLEFNISK
jgi:hypothetical protein